jgi:hypothetical protein
MIAKTGVRDKGYGALFLFSFLAWGETESIVTSATIWPTVPATDDDECGAVGGTKIGR